MKRLENILIKVVFFQLAILLISQILIQTASVQPYISKVIRYEGVNKLTISEWLETFKQ
ncbi:DUF5359 family protein [Metabacillus sp. RGM 3146]|uniref:DUF5359 family protein n=1 Tax=Metabacillus sp. RGM 3146 TaxID=3401092 RepID=UPI003B9C7020